MKRLVQLALLALCLVPTEALAHVGVGNTSGFMHVFMHPLSGLDHQLAMILVGIFAYQLGGRALWLVPLTFVSVMAFGGFLGVTGVPVPFVEVGIALSVIVLGAIVAFRVKRYGAQVTLRPPDGDPCPGARFSRRMPEAIPSKISCRSRATLDQRSLRLVSSGT